MTTDAEARQIRRARRRRRLRTAAIVTVALMIVGPPLVSWLANHTGDVRVVNQTLASARTAVRGEVQVDRVWKAEADFFPCCGASGPGGSFDGLLAGGSPREGAERVAAALRKAGWRTWQGGGVPDRPLATQDARTVMFDAAPAAVLEDPAGPAGGRGVSVLVLKLDAEDAALMRRHTGDLVVQVRTWAQSVYAPS